MPELFSYHLQKRHRLASLPILLRSGEQVRFSVSQTRRQGDGTNEKLAIYIHPSTVTVGIITGAFGAHAIKQRVTPDKLAAWQSASQYAVRFLRTSQHVRYI